MTGNSNRHSCNDRSARALRPSPPDAARTTSSAAKTAANQSESREKMAGIAEGRLREERRSWRKDHPIGFVARPRSKADGSTDLLNWDVVIPGKKDTMFCAVSVLRLAPSQRHATPR